MRPPLAPLFLLALVLLAVPVCAEDAAADQSSSGNAEGSLMIDPMAGQPGAVASNVASPLGSGRRPDDGQGYAATPPVQAGPAYELPAPDAPPGTVPTIPSALPPNTGVGLPVPPMPGQVGGGMPGSLPPMPPQSVEGSPGHSGTGNSGMEGLGLDENGNPVHPPRAPRPGEPPPLDPKAPPGSPQNPIGL